MHNLAPTSAWILLVLGLLSLPSYSSAGKSLTNPHLERAFESLTVKPTRPAKRLAAQLRHEAVLDQRRYDIDKSTVDRLGMAGFSAITQLLRDPDPRARAAGAFFLHRWDRTKSAPFLIGLLTDFEEWRHPDGLDASTPSRLANHLLGSMFACRAPIRVPAAGIDQRDAAARSQQNWYTYHLPYCLIERPSQQPLYQWYPMAAYTEIPVREIQQYRASHPDTFRQLLHVNFGAEHDRRTYSWRESIPVSLIFGNYGTETVWVRYDQSDSDVHRFELIGLDGGTARLRTDTLTGLATTTPLLQPIWGNYAGGLGPWKFDLTTMFEIPGPGIYRFRYRYAPPRNREEREYGEDVGLRIWGGEHYVDYFEFEVLATKYVKKLRPSPPTLVDYARMDNYQMVVRLLEKGIDVDSADKYGTTALIAAASNGSVRVLNVLLAKGADIEKRNRHFSQNALVTAISNNQLRAARLLVAAGADVDAEGNYFPLYWATVNGKTELVSMLIASGADVHRRLLNGETALFRAACNGHAATVKFLMEAGANVNAARKDGATPLMCAVEQNHLAIARVLLGASANPDARDDDGSCALSLALAGDDYRFVALLKSEGARPCSKDGVVP